MRLIGVVVHDEHQRAALTAMRRAGPPVPRCLTLRVDRARAAGPRRLTIGSARVTHHRVPLPGSLCDSIVPPISSARRRQMERPRPVPPKRRAVSVPTWAKG